MITTTRKTPIPETHEDIAARLRLAIAHMSRRLRQEARPGLSLSLISALSTVEAHGPLTPSELAARERLMRPGITRVIARLESEGLVHCERDPADGRSYRVEATQKGDALLRAARKRSREFLSRALSDLDERELDILGEAATRLERLLDAEE
jgi:DNA-binding MarR family transcriptional regulator